MKIPNREFSHQPYKATSVVTSHGQLDHFTCICRSNMCGCGYICHMMQARTKPRSVMMNNLNQKHHHTTTVTCVCLVYNTQTQSLSDPGWQSLQASNTWRQLNVMPSTITPELMFERIHPWKLPNKAWWQAMLTPSFFCHVRSCQQCAMSAHAICTCVTTSGDRIDEIKWENKCFHFTEGHSSRKLFIFSSAKQVCRRRKWLRCQSRHGHLNCRQHLEIKIWPARHEHLARHVSCTSKQRCRRHSARKAGANFLDGVSWTIESAGRLDVTGWILSPCKVSWTAVISFS